MSTIPHVHQLPLFPERICTKCGLPKNLEEFYVKDKRTGRRYSWCKTCHTAMTSAALRAKYVPHPRPLKDSAPAKACTTCGLVKSLDQFAPCAGAPHRRRSQCLACKRSDKRRYNDMHRAERKAYNDVYQAANREACAERSRRSRLKKAVQYEAVSKAWKAANKAAVNAMTHRRRARLKGNGGSWTAFAWERLKAQWDWRCALCGRQEMTDGIRLCFDHIVPVSKGGWNIIANGQPLCKSCNSKKHRRVLVVRRPQRP